MSRIALILLGPNEFPALVTDDPMLQVYSIDERFPDDRVYLLGPGVDRVTKDEFDVLVSEPIHQLGDKPEKEQAVRAHLNRRDDGKAGLSVVPPSK